MRHGVGACFLPRAIQNYQLKNRPALFGPADLVRPVMSAGTDFAGLTLLAGWTLPTPGGVDTPFHTLRVLPSRMHVGLFPTCIFRGFQCPLPSF